MNRLNFKSNIFRFDELDWAVEIQNLRAGEGQ